MIVWMCRGMQRRIKHQLPSSRMPLADKAAVILRQMGKELRGPLMEERASSRQMFGSRGADW